MPVPCQCQLPVICLSDKADAAMKDSARVASSGKNTCCGVHNTARLPAAGVGCCWSGPNRFLKGHGETVRVVTGLAMQLLDVAVVRLPGNAWRRNG